MTGLNCPNCSGRNHVYTTRVVSDRTVVDEDGNPVQNYDQITKEICYAECSSCGEVLIDG